MSLAVAVALVFAPAADAKRMGGKKMGRTYKTAPAPAKKQPQSGNTLKESSSASGQKATDHTRQSSQQTMNQGTRAQPQKSSRWGMLGGALAGLAAGGLLASLFGGGAFSGFQGLDFLVLILLAAGAFFLFRKFKQKGVSTTGTGYHPQNDVKKSFSHDYPAKEPVLQSSNGLDTGVLEERLQEPSVPQSTSGIIGGGDVPLNLPGGFDQEAFLKGARDHYHRLQRAWNDNDLGIMKEYLAADLYEQLAAERSQLKGKQHTEVLYIDASLVRADYTARVAQVSIRYTGRYRDEVEGVEEGINDIWHLERDITEANAPWYIVGMENAS
ncbi:Tim44-like domain-containing protein [Endozoicomonas sp. Mp262]|uniref:Tim44 domain-containing protein n=1 Tax=Endozoicomonas sp. Mp262 TaxID=2919499 RepID=UPI0021D83D46